MEVVKDSDTWGEVRVTAEGGGEGVPLVQNAEVVRDVNIATREGVRIQDTIIPTVRGERYERDTDHNRKVMEQLIQAGTVGFTLVG
jgi:hypothetical protein